MNVRQNPFSIYDFLGYLVPGAFSVYAALLAWSLIDPTRGFGQAVDHFGLGAAETYLPFVLFAYMLGHFLSFLSSITVEKYAVWAYGYPSKTLLNIPHPGYWHMKERVAQRKAIRLLVGLLLAPVSVQDYLLGRKLGMRELYNRALDPLLVASLKSKLQALFTAVADVPNPAEYGSAVDHDYFRFAYHYALEKASNHVQKFQNYVALYGLLRTITLVHVLLFWVSLVWLVVELWAQRLFGESAWSEAFFCLATALIACYCFYMAFVKFYRRFSLEALMAMAVVFSASECKTALSESAGRWFSDYSQSSQTAESV